MTTPRNLREATELLSSADATIEDLRAEVADLLRRQEGMVHETSFGERYVMRAELDALRAERDWLRSVVDRLLNAAAFPVVLEGHQS